MMVRPSQNDLVPGTILFRSFLFLDKNFVPNVVPNMIKIMLGPGTTWNDLERPGTTRNDTVLVQSHAVLWRPDDGDSLNMLITE